MRTDTGIICPLSGGNIVHTGSSSDGFVHFFESSTNQGIRYRRYRLDWGILELRGGSSRYFHVNGSEAIEVEKVGDKWLMLNATDEERQLALAEYSKRMTHALANLEFPTIKNVQTKLLANDIMPVLPDAAQRGKALELITVYTDDSTESRVVDQNARPNVSVDVCPLVEYITGKIGSVTSDNLEKIREMYNDDDIEIGDTIYAWDMGGWSAMAGRSGETVFRDNEYIASKLLKMS